MNRSRLHTAMKKLSRAKSWCWWPTSAAARQLIKKDLPMPKSIYFELATWPMIHFLYTYKTERSIRELLTQSRAPEKIARLLKVVRERLGHRLAFAVEDAKVALSEREAVDIPLPFVETELCANAARAQFSKVVGEKADRLARVAAGCIDDAGLRPDQIQTVFLTGGSSRVPAVRTAIAGVAPGARIATGSDLLSVARGLTREAAGRFA
jgi:hypothetical chaperone protein